MLKSYTWGATGLISERAAGQSRFHLYDSSGNTRLLVTASGTVLSRSAYNAWGAPLAGLAPATPLGYSGRFGGYTDAENGLILLGARYYAPALGRFLSRDPIGFDGGINLYNYCAGDPVNYFDATGEGPEYVVDWFKGFLARLFAAALAMNDATPAGTVCHLLGLPTPSELFAASWHAGSIGEYDGAYFGDSALMCLAFIGAATPATLPAASSAVPAVVAEEVTATGYIAKGGRLGNLTTRAFNAAIVEPLEAREWKLVRGGGLRSEEYIKSVVTGGKRGSSYPDITVKKNGRTLRINTVSTLADGKTLTRAEYRRLANLRKNIGPREHVLVIPKPF